MRLLLRLAVVAAGLWLPGGGPAKAAEVRAVSFCFNDRPPYAMAVDGSAGGLSVDVLREAARRAGLAARFAGLPWKRCLQAVQANEYDAVMDAGERPGFIHAAVSYTVFTNTFWVRDNDPITTFDPASLHGRRLGLVAGYVYGETLERLFTESGMIIERSVDDGTNIKKLGFGRTDVVVADFVSTRVFAAEKKLGLRALQPPHSYDRLYPSFNPSRRETMLAIDAALRSMCTDGWIDRAYKVRLGFGFDAVTGDGACAAAAAPGSPGQ